MPDDKAAKEAALKAAKDKLVVKGKKDGKLDQRDIFAAIPDVAENVDLLDSIYTEPSPDDFDDKWTGEDGEEIVLDDKVYLDDIADDSVRLYLREIGKIPLLTAEQELALAQRVVSGDKKAKDEMAEANMRLVVSI